MQQQLIAADIADGGGRDRRPVQVGAPVTEDGDAKKIAKEKSENSDDMRTLLRPRSRMLLKSDEGGLGGHYPLGHLRRGCGSISALRVTGDPAKGDPGGEAPPPPSFTGVILALRVTGTSHSPLSAG
jgi:hypothetical protein